MRRAELQTRVLSGARELAPLAARWWRRRHLVWLDSALGAQPGAMSVIGEAGPTGWRTGRGTSRGAVPEYVVERMRAAFERQRALRERPGADEAAGGALAGVPPGAFLGGWVGYLSYEAQIDFDGAAPDREGLLPYPRAWLRRVERGVTVCHDEQLTVLWAWVEAGEPPPDFDAWETALGRGGGGCGDRDGGPEELDRSGVLAPPLRPWAVAERPIDEAWHGASVGAVLDAIGAGDIYQANLTTRVPLARGSDGLGRYLALRRRSPGDYGGALRWPGLALLSTSPELFFSLRGGTITARPMKGTRPRGASPQDDEANAEALRGSEKDRAENLMIVDLMRNDVGRVAAMGSVEVPALFTVERYATVFQMTSTVTARLAERADIFSLLAALHPPGSMTGAPKIRATQIIRALEPAARGLYSGCWGAIDWSGDAVFDVVIRSVVATEGEASWGVGGGVVADSTPEGELREARDKLAALRQG